MGPPQQQQPVTTRVCRSQHDVRARPAAASSKRSASPESEPANGNGVKRSGGNSDGALYKTRRKRKSTFIVRKEEKELLLKELQALEAQVKQLRQQEPSQKVEKQTRNAVLHEMQRDQQRSIAVAQSAVTSLLNAAQANPLSTYIRLGKDWSERRETLLNIKETKIRNALEFVQARSQLLDPLKPHHSEERFETSDGDYCCGRFDMIQFRGAESVRQVYDALLYYLLNIEISVSESLGHITVREEYDSVENNGGSSNFRLQSTQFEVNVESNVVTFARFFENGVDSNGGEPCGVVVGDFVDEDELNPYLSKERARRDVSMAIVLTPHMKKKQKRSGGNDTEEDGEEELVVVMAQGKFDRLSHKELTLPELTVQQLRDNVYWGRVMVKTVNELLNSGIGFPVSYF